MQTLAARTGTGRRSPALDVVLAIVVGLLAALAKRYLDFRLGVPGHAGVGWITVLVAGRLINPRFGMATLAGVSMSLWGLPVGLGHSLPYNMALYGTVSAVLDTSGLMRLPISRAWGATLAGLAVHFTKFAFIVANSWLSGILRNVELYGFVAALRNHLLFGAAGGLLGWGLWRVGVAARGRWRRGRKIGA